MEKIDLLTQLNNAVKYVEENICDDIELVNIAKVTNYSPYHFGRLFYYIVNMPLSEYIRRRKMSLSAMELQNSNLTPVKIIDLAVKYGYDSADSFTKAFIKQHGITPTEARRNGAVLKIFPPITFQIKIQGVQGMSLIIEEKEKFEVFGIERRFKTDETDKIPAFWGECHQNGSYEKLLADAGGKNAGVIKKGACGINAICGYIYPGESDFSYMLFALKTADSKTDGYKIFNVPKSTWAVFRAETEHIGSEIPNLFSQADIWLSTSGYERAAAPDMEIYGDHFEEVRIPVVKK